MEKMIIYHGSSQIIESPEIKITKYNNDLFYVCSLMEYMARKTKNRRYHIVNQLGE